jgi:hypothetical protein
MQSNFYAVIGPVYNEVKFWSLIGGGIWSSFKVIEWFKTLKTNDLHHVQMGIDDLKALMLDQTTSIVNELKELRSDFRSYR